MRRSVALAFLFWLVPSVASANLSRSALDTVAVQLPPHARLDMALSAPDTAGRVRSLREIAGGRTLFINFVDYTCNTLCSTDLMLLTDAIRRAGLLPTDFRILVLGIDPKDGATAARKMQSDEIPPNLWVASVFLLPNQATIAKATRALGFHYVYDPQIDQFAHPAAVYVLAPDGTVRALLSPLTLTAGDLREVLRPAPSLNLYERIHALCYSFDPATGVYSPRISVLLKGGAIATLLIMAAAIALLSRGRMQP